MKFRLFIDHDAGPDHRLTESGRADPCRFRRAFERKRALREGGEEKIDVAIYIHVAGSH